MNLILHPGFGKCGSTTIQSALNSNRSLLEEQHIYLVDKDFVKKNASKFLRNVEKLTLVWYFEYVKNKKVFDAFEEALNDLITEKLAQGFKTILISAENLSNPQHHKEYEGIHLKLKKVFNINAVIVYVRRQDDHLISSWKQWHHKKGEGLYRMIENRIKIGVPDFKTVIDFYSNCYGKDTVSVAPLHRSALFKNDLFFDFCHKAGIKLPEYIESVDIKNSSGNFYLYEILSRISYLYDEPSDSKILRAINQKIDKNSPLLKNSSFPVLDNDMRRKVLEYFETDNKYLHQNFFSHCDFDELYPMPSEDNRNDSDKLREEVENLKDIVALQMEIILKSQRKNQKIWNKVKKHLHRLGLSYFIGLYSKFRK